MRHHLILPKVTVNVCYLGLTPSHNAYPTDGHYRPAHADKMARGRRRRCRKGSRFRPAQWRKVERLIRKDYSPEQASGIMKQRGELSISHETIYSHLWNDKASGGKLYLHLRGARKQRRKRYGRNDSRGRLAGKRNISERPATVETRIERGHWEIDTVMGSGKGCVLTLVERVSGYVLIGKLEARTVEETVSRACRLIGRHPGKFRTITADNGCEFHGYKQIEARRGVEFYFANPHHSWERGTNENTNGLIRQYLKKGTNLDSLTQAECDRIARILNNRPRKRHDYQTPEEVFSKI
jgi:transposase, IS30 family